MRSMAVTDDAGVNAASSAGRSPSCVLLPKRMLSARRSSSAVPSRGVSSIVHAAANGSALRCFCAVLTWAGVKYSPQCGGVKGVVSSDGDDKAMISKVIVSIKVGLTVR